MHPFTPVLAVTTPLPTGADYTNKRPYHNRGWCFMEFHISSIVKDNELLWDLSLHTEGQAISFGDCQELLKSSRKPFKSPELVARELREGVLDSTIAFTAAADVDVVVGLYQRGFVKAFETFRQTGGDQIYYAGLGWGSEEAPILAEALKYAHEHCKATDKPPLLRLDGNKFTPEDKKMLKAAVPDESRIELQL